METIKIINTNKSKEIKAPILTRTKNIVLHRTWTSLLNDINTRARRYTFSWTNGVETYRIIDVYNLKMKEVKYLTKIIQSYPIDLDQSFDDIKNDHKFESFGKFCKRIERQPHDAYKKGELYHVLNGDS
jgi:hypothetical protein